MGNCKPQEILEVEREIWLGIFRLARGEITVYSLVLELQTKFAAFDSSTMSSINNWFRSGNFFFSLRFLIFY